MAARLFVQCKTSQMPVSSHEKIKLMAEAACDMVWGGSFNSNPDGDRLLSYGRSYNPTCVLLVDYGPVDAESHTVIYLTWNGRKLYVSIYKSLFLYPPSTDY
jgi:hypothetical protein